jgi:hypothetical protein
MRIETPYREEPGYLVVAARGRWTGQGARRLLDAIGAGPATRPLGAHEARFDNAVALRELGRARGKPHKPARAA